MKKMSVLFLFIVIVVTGCNGSKNSYVNEDLTDINEENGEHLEENTDEDQVENKGENQQEEQEQGLDQSNEDNTSDELTQSSEALKEIALSWFDDYMSGDYGKLLSDYEMTDQLTSALTEEMFEQIKTQLESQLGPFEELIGTRYLEDKGYSMIYLHAQHEKDKISFVLVFDEAGNVAGVNNQLFDDTDFEPLGDHGVEISELQNPLENLMVEEEQVVFGLEEYPLDGTLLIPIESDPKTFVVFIHGSGPVNRDGEVGANTTYKDLALDFAEESIGSLRFDKRTLTHGEKAVENKNFTLYEESVEDASLAVEYLTERFGEDTNIYIIGHSLGGHLIPYIDQTMDEMELEVKGYVIMAGNARSIIEALPEQIEFLINLDGVVTEEELELKQAYEDSLDKLKDMDALSVDELVLGGYKAYWQSVLEYKPLDMVLDIEEPVLVLQGTRDYQVTQVDYDMWQEAMSSMDNASFSLIEGVNHLMIFGEGEPNNMEYNVPSEVSSDVANEIISFIKSN